MAQGELSLVRMRLLIDEMVPDSVTDFLRARGHDVVLVRDVLLPRTPDPVVATVGDEHSRVVVTWNRKDFRRLIRRATPDKYRNAGRICFKCAENEGLERLRKVIRHVELEYDIAQQEDDRRLIVEISTTDFRIIK